MTLLVTQNHIFYIGINSKIIYNEENICKDVLNSSIITGIVAINSAILYGRIRRSKTPINGRELLLRCNVIVIHSTGILIDLT